MTDTPDPPDCATCGGRGFMDGSGETCGTCHGTGEKISSVTAEVLASAQAQLQEALTTLEAVQANFDAMMRCLERIANPVKRIELTPDYGSGYDDGAANAADEAREALEAVRANPSHGTP